MDEFLRFALSVDVALVLISEKARFWSDDQVGVDGKALPPRCMDPARLTDLRQSLIEIDFACKTALRISRPKET